MYVVREDGESWRANVRLLRVPTIQSGAAAVQLVCSCDCVHYTPTFERVNHGGDIRTIVLCRCTPHRLDRSTVDDACHTDASDVRYTTSVWFQAVAIRSWVARGSDSNDTIAYCNPDIDT